MMRCQMPMSMLDSKGLWTFNSGRSFSGIRCGRLAIILIVCWVLVLSGCATTDESAPTPSALAANVPASKQKINWQAQYPVDKLSVQALGSPLAPAKSDGRVLVTPTNAGVRVIDSARGRTLRDETLSGADKTPMHIVSVGMRGDDVYLASLEGDVIALSVADGEERWRQDLAGEVLSQPAISDSEIVYHTGDGRLVCLDRATGKNLWVFRETLPSLTLRGTSAPVISGDRVVAGFADGHLLALDLATGAVDWDTVVGEPKGHSALSRMTDIDAGLLIVDDLVYATAYQGRTVAVSLSSGRIVWSRDLATYTGMSIWGDRLFMSGPDGEVWALDRNTGEILWRQDALMYRRLSAPIAFDSGIYVIDFEGYMHRISGRDGHLMARRKVASESDLTSLLMRISDHLLVADSEGRLWLLDQGGAE